MIPSNLIHPRFENTEIPETNSVMLVFGYNCQGFRLKRWGLTATGPHHVAQLLQNGCVCD